MSSVFDASRTTVNGVPTYWVPMEGPISACLSFRVGVADETLPTLGITHLVEHLAMRGLEHERFANNATVMLHQTSFIARGSRDEIAGFLAHVCRNLENLPLNLLDDERRILAAEAETRTSSLIDILDDIRFGPSGAGLNMYRQFGVQTVQPEAVHAWAQSRFIVEDAALWLTADPADLALELGHGVAHLPADPLPLPLPLPASTSVNRPSVCISMLGQRSWDLSLATGVASERAHVQARHGAGISYSVQGIYEHLGPKTAHVGLMASCERPSEGQTIDILERVLGELAAKGPTEGELEQACAEMEKAYSDPLAIPGFLGQLVESELVRCELDTAQSLIEGCRAVSPADVAAAIGAALPTAIVSSRAGLARAGYRTLSFAPPAITGMPHPMLSLRGLLKSYCLVANDEGIAFMINGRLVAGVRYDDCELVVADGPNRTLIGRDGRELAVRPRNWLLGSRLVKRIDAAVPRTKVHVVLGKTGYGDSKPGGVRGISRRLRTRLKRPTAE